MSSVSHAIRSFLLLPLILLPVSVSAGLLPIEKDNIRVFKQVSPYVVNVHRLIKKNQSYWNRSKASAGVGSGFIWDDRGYVVTNYHVVRNAHEVWVTFNNGKKTKARLVGVDKRQDIAVLRLRSTRDLPKPVFKHPMLLAKSSELQVGQVAMAIGNPFGLSQTFTEGVVSALNRDVMTSGAANSAQMIQTDASINPGNSGGPLLNSQGYLIGMNTLIFSRSGSSAGIGFAVPSAAIKRAVNQIIQHGKVVYAGIGIVPINDALTAAANIKGVVISRVIKGSSAARAGLRGLSYDHYGELRVGDIIIGVNKKRVKSVRDLYRELDKVGVKKTISLQLIRNGRHKKRVKLKTQSIH